MKVFPNKEDVLMSIVQPYQIKTNNQEVVITLNRSLIEPKKT